jgi:hypothetical protein
MINHNEIISILHDISNKFAENGMLVTFKSEDGIIVQHNIFGGIFPNNDTGKHSKLMIV